MLCLCFYLPHTSYRGDHLTTLTSADHILIEATRPSLLKLESCN